MLYNRSYIFLHLHTWLAWNSSCIFLQTNNLIKRADNEKSKDNNIYITHFFPSDFSSLFQYHGGKQLKLIISVRQKIQRSFQDSRTRKCITLEFVSDTIWCQLILCSYSSPYQKMWNCVDLHHINEKEQNSNSNFLMMTTLTLALWNPAIPQHLSQSCQHSWQW